MALSAAACSSTQPTTVPAGAQVRSEIPSGAARFDITSPDVQDGKPFPADEFSGVFGCHGSNRAPRLSWNGAPPGTRSFAVTMFDQDAPTGSGFWHWMAWDIPAAAHEFTDLAAAEAVSGTNNAGTAGYLGPCPPAGDAAHHYRITVLALNTPSVNLPPTTPPAVVTFTMNSHVIGYARMTATARLS